MWSSGLTFFLISQCLHVCLTNIPSTMVHTSFKTLVVGMCHTMMVGGLAITIYQQDWLVILDRIIF